MDAQQKPQNTVQIVVRALEVDIVWVVSIRVSGWWKKNWPDALRQRAMLSRQALNELESAGLLVREAHKGTTVCEYSAEEVNQLYQLRDYLERQAALLIPLPVNDEEIRKLKNLCDEHCAAIAQEDMVRVIAANKEFHQVLFRLCGNIFLAGVIDEMAKKQISSVLPPALI